MTEQTRAALQNASVVFFMVDARTGITPMDLHFAKWLRRELGQIKRDRKTTTVEDIIDIPVVLIANKCEGNVQEEDTMQAAELGFGNAMMLSAEHNIGLSEVYEVL